MNIKVERNYLEINSIEDLNYSKKPSENCNLKFIDPPDFQINKFFYKQIGKDHRWIDRLVWNDQQWIQYLENSKVKTYVIQDKEELIGYCEKIFHYEKKNCEIAYFGVLKEYYGKKYGGFLLSKSIEKSFKEGIEIFKSETVNLNINKYNFVFYKFFYLYSDYFLY